MIGLLLILPLGTGLVWLSIIFCRDAQHQANLVSAQEAARPASELAPDLVTASWSELDDRQLTRFLDESS
jgi:hypothetical protein